LASAEDLALLVYVYQKHGHLKELLKILDSDQIGVNSKLGLTDGQFINAKIEVLTRENMFLELRIFCESLLQDVTDYTEKNRVNDPAVKETSADNWTVFAAFVGIIDYSDTKFVPHPIFVLYSLHWSPRTKMLLGPSPQRKNSREVSSPEVTPSSLNATPL